MQTMNEYGLKVQAALKLNSESGSGGREGVGIDELILPLSAKSIVLCNKNYGLNSYQMLPCHPRAISWVPTCSRLQIFMQTKKSLLPSSCLFPTNVFLYNELFIPTRIKKHYTLFLEHVLLPCMIQVPKSKQHKLVAHILQYIPRCCRAWELGRGVGEEEDISLSRNVMQVLLQDAVIGTCVFHKHCICFVDKKLSREKLC